MGGRKTRFFNENLFLGGVPVEWRVVFAKDVLIKQARPTRPGDDVVTCFRDGQVVLRSARRPDGFTIAMKEHGYQGIRVGDLVIHAMDAFAGAIGVSESNGKGSPVLSVCSVSANADAKYYSYLFRSLSYSGYIESVGKGIRERSTDYRFSEIRKTAVPLPPLPEQRAIAAYLDHHVSLIDRERDLIAEKIDLLKDKRRAMIYEAVTGKRRVVDGDDEVPMVDSGVEWIGEVPEGWNTSAIKEITVNLDGKRVPISSDKRIAGTTPYYGPGGISDYVRGLTHEGRDLILVGEDGAPFGDPHRDVSFLASGKIWVNNHVHVIRANDPHSASYIMYSLNCVDYPSIVGGATLMKLTQKSLSSIRIPLPPFLEQQAISNYLNEQTTLIDQEVDLLTQKRDLLGEQRKAMIFEAVTGKLDIS